MMKKKHTFPMVVGALSLLGITTTAIAVDGKAVTPEVAVSETLTATAQVQAVDLKNRQLTLKNQEGHILTVNVPPEVRRLAEIKAGDLIVTEYREALALGLRKTSSSGIQARRESVSIERTGKDQPPGGVARENVQVLASIIAIDRAKRRVTIKGAEQTVVLTAPQDIDLADIKVGDEVLAEYIQELAINVEPAPATAVDAWNARQ